MLSGVIHMDLNPHLCQKVIYSEALKRQRQCRNKAGSGGCCTLHTTRPNAVEPSPYGIQPVRTRRKDPAVAPLLDALRAYLRGTRTPSTLDEVALRGRLVNALAEYDGDR